jgi:hypothetical protein
MTTADRYGATLGRILELVVLLNDDMLSAIEIPVLQLLLPWKTVQIISFVLGTQGLFWMIGLLASLRVHPHVVSDAGLQIRDGASLDFTIPWDAIGTIGTRIRSLPNGRTVQYDRAGSDPILHIAMSSQTNVDVVLRHPITVSLPGGSSEPITELRFYADDSSGLATRAREHLTADLAPKRRAS